MINIKSEINNFFNEIKINNNYISRSEVEIIKDKYKYLYLKIRRNIIRRIIYSDFYNYYKNIYKLIKKQNEEYIDYEIKNNSMLLDNINNYSLDIEQKRAVICDEDNILVVAGAGAGKSLTIIGKIRYLIEQKNISEEQILCISFTNDSASKLKKTILDSYGYNIDVFTFHKLGLNILNDNIKNINISPSDLLEYIIDEIFKCIDVKENNLLKMLRKNILTFIKLFKSKGYTIDYFNIILDENNKHKNKYLREKNKIIINIIKQIYIIYENELLSQGNIDFDDMIVKATKYVSENGIDKNYKYIIIDEYQDTSYVRYKLIYEIKKCCDSKIMAVGDDFQSIYRFTGCDLNIFLNFEKYYGYSEIIKIRNTYRNSIELINVAGNFIMKNRFQIKKELRSNKTIQKPIKIFYYKNEKEDFSKLLKYIYEKNKSNLYIICRNNNDINNIINNKIINENNKITFKDIKDFQIEYYTVHKSKGLESDNVVLINLKDDKMGFPSKIQNDDIISLILNEKDTYPYEEERRLFYVALTRTKNNVYLYIDKNKESIFVKELIKDAKNNIEYINT